MSHLHVRPRPTPGERPETDLIVDVDERLGEFAAVLEDWVEPRQDWELTLQEGHDFGRANNVEAEVLYASGEQTSSLSFRLEQLDDVTDTGEELVLRFEERDGIARLARLKENGLEVELFHILTFT